MLAVTLITMMESSRGLILGVRRLQALMPVAVFVVGCALHTESFSFSTLGNMVLISIGVAIASYGTHPWLAVSTGRTQCFDTSPRPFHARIAVMTWLMGQMCHAAGELNFVLTGVILQMLSIGTESTRLVLVQILLQRKGLKLNPITSLYYISPCCFAFLAIPFFLLELPKIRADPSIQISAAVFLSNAAAAFGAHCGVDSSLLMPQRNRVDGMQRCCCASYICMRC